MKYLIQLCSVFITFQTFIHGAVYAKENKTVMYFPDDNGNPVSVPIACHRKLETYHDISSKVRFHLYSRFQNKVTNIQMKVNETLPEAFLRREPTKILIHGFYNTLKADMIQKIMDAYLDPKQNDSMLNVLAVDWGDLAGLSLDCYLGPKRRTKDVGRYLALFIDHLVQRGAVDLGKLHLIGHSLGAHVAGIAGLHVARGKVARITGLDPAGVFYASDGLETKLDKTDAIFVDVIHTNTQLLGYRDPCGHVDFYPHGGASQPNCPLDTCSHSQAHVYFRDSIFDTAEFKAYECDSLRDIMGCYDLKILSTEGCVGCRTNSSNFMGEFADSADEDTLYFASPPVPGSRYPSFWNVWGLPSLLSLVAISGGAGVLASGAWVWRKYRANASTSQGR